MKKLYLFSILLFLISNVIGQTANTSPLPAGETVIGAHLHAGSGNEVWTDATSLYFNYRGAASTTHFWNLGGSTGKSIMTLLSNGNVGIGSSSPSQKLTIGGGKIRLEDETNSYSNFIYASLVSSNYRSGQILESNGSINFGLNGNKQAGFGFRWLAKDNSPVNYFDDSNELMRLTFDGKLGIGTTSPSHPLTVRPSTDIDAISWQRSVDGHEVGRLGVTGTVGSGRYGWIGLWNSSGTQTVQIDAGGGISFINSGNFGIGNNSPQGNLHIGKQEAPANTAGESIRLVLQPYGHTGGPWKFICRDAPGNAYLDLYYGTGQAFTIHHSGNILIGKTTQTNTAYKLDVAGKIRADEIVVNTTGADFVFEPTYQLMSLQNLETYLKANRHLPGIAPAAEMQENGVSAGEMQTKLLQKVEELTLYSIELNKKLEEQAIINKELMEKIEKIGHTK